jgi:hypothetical protein
MIVDSANAPALAPGGTGYGLAWWAETAGALDGPRARGLHFTPLDALGEPVSEEALLAGGSESGALVPFVAWTGENFAVLWSAPAGSEPGLFLSRVGPNGEATEPRRLPLSSRSFIDPRVAWNGSELALVWADRRDGPLEIYFVGLDAEGDPIGSETRVSRPCEECSRPMLAWSGEEYVAWSERIAAGESKVHFQRLARNGNRLGQPLSWDGSLAGLAYGGEFFGVLYGDESARPFELFVAHVDASIVRERRAIEGIESPPSAFEVAIAAHASAFAAAWQAEGFQIFFGQLDCP